MLWVDYSYGAAADPMCVPLQAAFDLSQATTFSKDDRSLLGTCVPGIPIVPHAMIDSLNSAVVSRVTNYLLVAYTGLAAHNLKN